jgi:hypothetical protein
MTRSATRIILSLLISATLLGGYVIVERHGPTEDRSGEGSSMFLH